MCVLFTYHISCTSCFICISTASNVCNQSWFSTNADRVFIQPAQGCIQFGGLRGHLWSSVQSEGFWGRVCAPINESRWIRGHRPSQTCHANALAISYNIYIYIRVHCIYVLYSINLCYIHHSGDSCTYIYIVYFVPCHSWDVKGTRYVKGTLYVKFASPDRCSGLGHNDAIFFRIVTIELQNRAVSDGTIQNHLRCTLW